MDNTYKTQVDLSIGYKSVKSPDFDYESRYLKTNISYEITVNYKSWGISSIYATMPDQKLDLELEVIMTDKEDPEYIQLSVSLKDIKIQEATRINPQSDFCPSELEIDLNSITKISEGKYSAIASGTLVFNNTAE